MPSDQISARPPCRRPMACGHSRFRCSPTACAAWERATILGTSNHTVDDEWHGRRRRRHSGPNTDPSLKGWGENRCGAGECPIITYGVGSRAMLVSGAHVIITATQKPDGSLTPQRVGVGQNGLTPSM